MRKHGIKGVVVVVAIGALALASSAAGGSAGAWCPQSSASGCEQVGARTGDGSSNAKKQRVRTQPRVVFEQGGQQIWCAGKHCMY
jgi:hypothetical protein